MERHASRISRRKVHPRVVRGAGGAETGERSGELRGTGTELWRAEPEGQSAGALPEMEGGGAGGAGRNLCRTGCRDGGGAAGDSEGWRRLSAAGSGVSGGTARLHAVGCESASVVDGGEAAGRDAGV